MKIVRLSLAVVAILGLAGIFAGALSAQESSPSDLVGTWVLNLAKSKPDKRFPITSQTLVIAYSGQTIQFNYTTDGKPLAFTYIVDGKERTTPNPTFKNSADIIKATWKKSALDVVNMRQMGPVGYSVTSTFLSEHWTLSSDSKTLTEKTGSDFDSCHVYVYDKQ